MNYQRITISLPGYIYEQLVTRIQPGRVSDFVRRALEEKLLELRVQKKKDPFEEFLALGRTMPKRTTKQILAAIHKGRT